MPLPMLHPAVTELIARVSSLRAEVARLLVAIDDKIFLEKLYLLALHEQKIGRAELSLMRSEHQVRKLRRLVERVQAATSRHESFDVETIEAELTAELAAWEEKLADRVRFLAETQWATEPVDAALAVRRREAAKLFRRLAGRLHPDLHPNQSERHRLLFLRATASYHHDDPEALRLLELLVDDGAQEVTIQSSLEVWTTEETTLRAHADRLLRRLAEIDATPPFSLARNLHDETWVQARRAEIGATSAALDVLARELEAHLATLDRAADRGASAGIS